MNDTTDNQTSKIVKIKDPVTGKEIEVKVKQKLPKAIKKPVEKPQNVEKVEQKQQETEEKVKKPRGRPLLFNDVKKLDARVKKYFKSCWTQKIDMWGNPVFIKDANGKKTKKKVMIQSKPYTVGGLAVFLDCSEDSLVRYRDGEGERKEFCGTIKRACDIIYSYKQEYLYSGRNTVGAIFDLKNNYGWKDKVETEHSGNITWIEEAPK